ncbi:hypothetical protein [Marinifilum sp.]|uniref:hypothetical protein n=1 Tax=Marinifilum sp. TaxID=2033137 RepID=UPI003BA91FBF
MIIEKHYLLLKDELSRTVVEFEKDNNDYKTFFNGHSNLEYYKLHLNKLQIDFVNELRSNLTDCKTQGEIHMYLLTTKRIFELIKARLQSTTETDYSGLNVKMISKLNNEISCINTGPEEFMYVEQYLHCQYQVTLDVISVVNDCLENFSQSGKKKSSKKNKLEKGSWQDDIKEHYNTIMKMKDDLYRIISLEEKMEHVLNVKEGLVLQFQNSGKDFYSSSLSVLFEIRLDCYREMLLSADKGKSEKQIFSRLLWNKSKTDFLEIMDAFHLTKAISSTSGDPPTRKELIEIFVTFLNIDPIPDHDSRITKLHDRINPFSFLEKLKNAIELYISKR